MTKSNADSQVDDYTTERELFLKMLLEVDDIDEGEYQKHFSIASGHLDPERVFLAAVGELRLTQMEHVHMESCDDCSEHLALWRSSAAPSGPMSGREFFPVAPMRLAASNNEPVVLGEWTVCNSPSTRDASSTNPTVLRIERDVSAIGDETAMIRLDWQDERGRVLGSTLGVLDRSLPVVTDEGVKTRVRIAEVSVPDSIASVSGASLSNIKVVTCLDDIGVSAIECLTRSLAQSLSLELTKWNAWAKALESILEHSPKVPDEVEAKVRLILAACQPQGENKEGLKRFNSTPSCRLEWQADLFEPGTYRSDIFSLFKEPVSVVSLLVH